MNIIRLKYVHSIKPVRCEDNANGRKESVLSVSRVQLILCKDNARRAQQQGGKTLFYRIWYCRAEAYLLQRYTDISVFTISFMYNNNLGMKKIKNRGVKFKTLTKFIYLFKLKQWYRHRRRKPPSSDFRHIVKASAQSCHTDCPTNILYFIYIYTILL